MKNAMRPIIPAVILTLGSAPGAAQAGCFHKRPPQIAVEAHTERFEEIAAELPPGLQGAHTGRVAATWAIQTAGQGACAHVTAVSLTLTHSSHIAVLADHAGTCRAALIRDHEEQHRAAEMAELDKEAAALRTALALILSDPITREDAEEAIAHYLAASGRRYDAAIVRAHAEIDTPRSSALMIHAIRNCSAQQQEDAP